jgi:hypothetical protein
LQHQRSVYFQVLVVVGFRKKRKKVKRRKNIHFGQLLMQKSRQEAPPALKIN